LACRLGSSRLALAQEDCFSAARQRHRACVTWSESVVDLSSNRRSVLNRDAIRLQMHDRIAFRPSLLMSGSTPVASTGLRSLLGDGLYFRLESLVGSIQIRSHAGVFGHKWRVTPNQRRCFGLTLHVQPICPLR
jgi:hypothetical protein